MSVDSVALAFAGPLSSRWWSSVPRFPDRNLDAIAFMYPTEQHARRKERLGGTAFLVGRVLDGSGDVYGTERMSLRLVSNRHVVLEGGACFAAFNRVDGGEPDIIETDQNLWVTHKESDLAIYDLRGSGFDVFEHRHAPFIESQFVTREMIKRDHIGIGEEVVMMGRFINLQQTGAVRFGSISSPLTPISFGAPWPHTEECFSAEMRSRTGFSGSPVAVYRTLVSVMTDLPEGAAQNFYRLLGVNCGYIIDRDQNGQEENTWLNAVIPAWRISELLDTPAMKKAHARDEADMRAQQTTVKAHVKPVA